MQRINSEGWLTRKERLAAVIAIIAALGVHVVFLLGWGLLYRWSKEEKKKERLMVIRRVQDLEPPLDRVRPLARTAPSGEEGKSGGKPAAAPPPQKSQVKEQGSEPPQEELTRKMGDELQEEKTQPTKVEENAENTVGVVTDLPAASFILSGPAEYRGAGTYWIRKGAPPGKYTVTFHPVAGYVTPPIQAKDLLNKGQIIFVGKYKKSVEILVESNITAAQVTIYRPDGRPLNVTELGRIRFEDLPLGNYTSVFKDRPGFITPSPIVRNLVAGGNLTFFGEYREGGVGTSGRGTGSGTGIGDGTGLGSRGRGHGGGGTGFGDAAGKLNRTSHASSMDKRVQMVVKSYPSTNIEEDFSPISYPELIIERSDFQQGWCQVYLIISIAQSGVVKDIYFERPQPGEQTRYAALIQAVENAVRGWDFANVEAEVHVDVRFYVE